MKYYFKRRLWDIVFNNIFFFKNSIFVYEYVFSWFKVR